MLLVLPKVNKMKPWHQMMCVMNLVLLFGFFFSCLVDASKHLVWSSVDLRAENQAHASMSIKVFLKLGWTIPKRYYRVEKSDEILYLNCKDGNEKSYYVGLALDSLNLVPNSPDLGDDFIILPLNLALEHTSLVNGLAGEEIVPPGFGFKKCSIPLKSNDGTLAPLDVELATNLAVDIIKRAVQTPSFSSIDLIPLQEHVMNNSNLSKLKKKLVKLNMAEKLSSDAYSRIKFNLYYARKGLVLLNDISCSDLGVLHHLAPLPLIYETILQDKPMLKHFPVDEIINCYRMLPWRLINSYMAMALKGDIELSSQFLLGILKDPSWVHTPTIFHLLIADLHQYKLTEPLLSSFLRQIILMNREYWTVFLKTLFLYVPEATSPSCLGSVEEMKHHSIWNHHWLFSALRIGNFNIEQWVKITQSLYNQEFTSKKAWSYLEDYDLIMGIFRFDDSKELSESEKFLLGLIERALVVISNSKHLEEHLKLLMMKDYPFVTSLWFKEHANSISKALNGKILYLNQCSSRIVGIIIKFMTVEPSKSCTIVTDILANNMLVNFASRRNEPCLKIQLLPVEFLSKVDSRSLLYYLQTMAYLFYGIPFYVSNEYDVEYLKNQKVLTLESITILFQRWKDSHQVEKTFI